MWKSCLADSCRKAELSEFKVCFFLNLRTYWKWKRLWEHLFAAQTQRFACQKQLFLQLPSAKGNMEWCSLFFLPFVLKQLHVVPNTSFRHHLGSDFPLALSHFMSTLQEGDKKPNRNACDILSGAQSACKTNKGMSGSKLTIAKSSLDDLVFTVLYSVEFWNASGNGNWSKSNGSVHSY